MVPSHVGLKQFGLHLLLLFESEISNFKWPGLRLRHSEVGLTAVPPEVGPSPEQLKFEI